MATYRDLHFDWSMLCQECTDCWTASDLQLAAELGKTLLERNKELENSVKQHQNIIEDQTQEIEYLTKQTAALREVNDSRLRIYEQLEVSIQELERANQRLALENSADKKHIKSLCLSIDSLESRCEELQRALDEVTLQQNSQARRQQRSKSSSDNRNSSGPNIKLENEADQHGDEGVDMKENAEDEEVIRLLEQLQESRSQRVKEQRKISELEEQLAGLLQENLALEEQLTLLRQKEEDMKSLQEEISTLEEVRQGHLCGRCLRNMDSRGHDELSMMLDHEEEEEDGSVVNSVVSETHRSMIMLQIQDPSIEEGQTRDNPYRVLVEKYEALLEMQRRPAPGRQHHVAPSTNCLSLQEELQLSGDFSSFNGKVEADAESDNEGIESAVPSKSCKKETDTEKKAEKAFSATPTDFSEAETSSSGFSDEISNKATQTEGHLPPGSFLCSIADGDDCRFSIYDDASPIESRFRKTPEYRQLFREIFAVLKRAAEAKDEGEQLPLLEDLTPVAEAPKVPPVTPSKEELPNDFHKRNSSNNAHVSNPDLPNKSTSNEDTAGSIADKEIILDTQSDPKVEHTAAGCNPQDLNDSLAKETDLPQPKAAPKKDILEYLSVGVGVRKKSHGRKNSPMKTLKPTVAERVEQIESIPSVSSCTSVTSANRGRRKREVRNFDKGRGGYSQSPIRGESPMPFDTWKKQEIQNSPCSQQKPSFFQQSSYQRLGHQQQSTWDFQPFISSASQEVAKLKRLEKSYAEVLRLGPQKCSNRPIPTNGYRK
ncbi:cerebellar degeneration-related protein 2 isoform X3 [Zootermopsis nevadensis]|uniref:cerebellar degeneration-related protein 2 isoform X3 n=1 Tax=Zootermopsis nevadensis TaxID=136037 RepID=UPI000B8EA726|nr:cerebellar degeneration-related protein 2 isoform X3 [Zootermopsis nevadensis]